MLPIYTGSRTRPGPFFSWSEPLTEIYSNIDTSRLSNGHIAWLQTGRPDAFDRRVSVPPATAEMNVKVGTQGRGATER